VGGSTDSIGISIDGGLELSATVSEPGALEPSLFGGRSTLTITEVAAQAIGSLLYAVHPPREQAGLRIAPPREPSHFCDVVLVNGPAAGDQVVKERGVRVFVAPEIAERVEGKALDVRIARGSLCFALCSPPEPCQNGQRAA
jgi:Fe-S cluster assembly iron-binding protein IscA